MTPENSTNKSLQAEDLRLCMIRDQHQLRRKIARLGERAEKASEELIDQINQRYRESCLLVESRRQQGVKIEYPDALPVSQQVSDIRSALLEHQVVVIAGETGSGKTTQIPKVCLELGLSDKGLIGHTQPRRLAARTVANRIAEELNVELGSRVGFQVRFTDQSSPETLIKVMTDGILLAEIKNDPLLLKYQAIIIDEAHERSLNIDFLLGYLKNLIQKRKDLKLVITSATIDVDRFSAHFNNAPVISVEGRTFPVEVKYQADQLNDDVGLPEQIEQAIQQIIEDERDRKWRIGDVLVFLPGEREIREVAKHLRHADWRDTEITPLYARLSNEEQSKIFKGHAGRRIVLATNVAETSITVPGIRYVVDSGLARMSRYSVRSKIQRLPIEAISQASANQRKGRCGRVAEGICYRLYSEEDFNSRPQFTDPEILRTNLASVVLKMLDVGLGDVRKFPFIDMPESKLWNDGFKLLFELGAVNRNNKLTSLGRELAKLPIDPKLARILFQANETNCLQEALVIVSGLSIQDPRERPADKRQAADQAHAVFKDVDSDFVSLLKLFNSYEAQRQELGSSALKRYAQKNYLSFMRMREWREMHRQLVLATKAWNRQSTPESVGAQDTSALLESDDKDQKKGTGNVQYQRLHGALLSGFLSNVARHDEKREYLACRNKKIQIYPGSGLSKAKAKWIMSAELVETQQIFARTNARIEPEWIEPLAQHLTKKSWSEPHYQKKRGQVLAYEKVTLYGLEIVARRLVNYGSVDELVAREVFIRSALVEGEYRGRVKAVRNNLQALSELEKIEDRTRRKDVAIDDEALFSLYDKVLPAHIVSDASLEKWYRSADAEIQARLEFGETDLKLDNAEGFDANLFPDQLENNGIKFPLSYAFKPGTDEDGVSVSVPARAVRQVTAARIEKLVPGLLREKCVQLIKNLPRSLRKHFVPVPDTVNKIFDKVEASNEPLLETLATQLRFLTNVTIPIEAWNVELLDPHLRLNIKLLDDKGKVLKQSRELGDLVDVADEYLSANPAVKTSDKESAQDEYVEVWDFDLVKEQEVSQAGISLKVYPCLEDHRTKVLKTTRNDVLEAKRLTRLGFARLLSFKLRDQIALFPKEIPEYKQMGLYYAPIGKAERLYDDFALACIVNHFGGDDYPLTAEEFEQRWQNRRGDFVLYSREFAKLAVSILSEYHELMKRLKGKINFTVAMSVSDLKHQIEHLIFDGFLSRTPYENLSQFPRYLKACSVRFEKMAREQALERKALPLLRDWWEQYQARAEQHRAQGIYDIELERFRWLIEEQRVSWFAQQLGTAETVSEKRLNKQWQLVRRV